MAPRYLPWCGCTVAIPTGFMNEIGGFSSGGCRRPVLMYLPRVGGDRFPVGGWACRRCGVLCYWACAAAGRICQHDSDDTE